MGVVNEDLGRGVGQIQARQVALAFTERPPRDVGVVFK